MKRKLTALKSLMIVGAFLLPLNLLAQEDVGALFKASPQDATKLVDAYMRPLFKGLGIGLNSGWNNTAKTKSFLRFDLRFTGTLAFVPDADKTYDVNSLNLQDISPVNPNVSTGPTAFGKDQEGARMKFNGAPATAQFNLPQGSGLSFVPAPQIQLTVGLPKNIDVSLRLVPNIKLGDEAGSVNMIGVGAKIEVLPLIMGKKDKIVPFDLAVALGFTRLNYNLPLDINNKKYPGQEVDIKINGFSAEAIISKKILFFTPFASVGYNTSTSRLNALGTYDFAAPTITNPNNTRTETNPVSLKNNDINGMKASLGFQLNLAFLRFYASYTTAQYSYFNGGIGIGIGK